jgi:hypothetical protein
MTYPYVSGAVLLASDLNTDFAAKSDLAMTQNAQTGVSYSFALADASKLLTTSNASTVSVTVTKQATVTWVTGTQLRIMNLGAGVTTLVADTGVTINGNVALNQYQGGTLIRTASDVWLFVPTASSSGMDLITPTSVAGSGVTLSGGQVTFTASTTVSVNGCFTSAYANYWVIFEGVQSAGQSVDVRLRASGTDASGSNYTRQLLSGQTGTPGAASVTGTLWDVVSVGDADAMVGEMILRRPNLAQTTLFSSQGGRGTYLTVLTGLHSLTTQYDGLSLLAAGGTNITGTLRIYGLRNS